ncbi:MAG: hypothetical protein K2O16_15940 [Lachnospiraceae bacterium]|nr:hypothetical protein [Lachnospiraceae bacterium]
MNGKKKLTVLVVCGLLLLAVMGGTFAWYLKEDAKRAQMQEAQVMAPYNLYLLNPNASDTLQFAVGNLHPGEMKQAVVCVSNMRPDDYEGDEDMDMAALAKESEFGYDLMLVHTENLAVDYHIYPLQRHEMAGTLPSGAIIMEDDTKDHFYWTKSAASLNGSDISEDMRKRVFGEQDADKNVNVGTYWLSDDEDMMLAYHIDEKGNGSYEYDYYLIEIKWQNINNFDDYKKETDLVYVVVNAKQPRPVEKPGRSMQQTGMTGNEDGNSAERQNEEYE